MSRIVRRVLLVVAFVVLPWIVVPWLVLRRLLTPDEDLTRYDLDDVPLMGPRTATDAADAVDERLHAAHESFGGRVGSRARVEAVRRWMDQLGEDVETDATIRPVDDGPVRGEWVLAPGHDPDRRLLYIHGGAFQAGSPLSHRSITTALAARTRASVFVMRYRLQPEHRRRDSIEDTHAAWEWMVRTGPDGPGPATHASAAGDSAGGNLVLELVNWLRDEGGRQADRIVALSPLTDTTFSGDSWTTNRDSDAFIGPSIGRLLALPRTTVLTGLWLSSGIRPDDPSVSPLLADLHDLPPVLVQASDDEMVRDDAVRYVTKARAAGSPAEMQLWPGLPHVFQAFGDLPQAQEALDEAGRFLTGDTTSSESATTAA